jgi:hypothetical protein
MVGVRGGWIGTWLGAIRWQPAYLKWWWNVPRSAPKSNVVFFGRDPIVVLCPHGMTVGTQEWLDYMADYFWDDFCLRSEQNTHEYFTWVSLMHHEFWKSLEPWV